MGLPRRPQVQLEVASAGDSSQLVFSAAPGGEELISRLSAPAPGAEAAVAADPAANPAPLQPGSSIALRGRVGGLSQQHADTNGSSTVNITLTGLPANYSDAAVVCAFVLLDHVQPLETEALQRNGTTDFTAQQDLLDQYLHLVFAQTPANASLVRYCSSSRMVLDRKCAGMTAAPGSSDPRPCASAMIAIWHCIAAKS